MNLGTICASNISIVDMCGAWTVGISAIVRMVVREGHWMGKSDDIEEWDYDICSNRIQ